MLHITGAGAEREGDVIVDEHIPLSVEWPPQRVPALWWMFTQPRSMLEISFDMSTGELVDATLILPGPTAVVSHGPPPTAPQVMRGVPRADPAEWARRAPTGSVEEFRDHYIREHLPVRTELGPDHVLIRIGLEDEVAASEMVCGRLRAGLSASQALLWLCVGGFSPEQRALLEDHAARSNAPPTGPEPPPATSVFSRFISVFKRR